MGAGRTVLVTGGTSGIGRAIAESFAARGARVTVTGKTEREVADFLANSPEESLLARRMDIAEPADIASILSEFSRLDVVVNAAGVILRGGQEFDPEQFAAVVDVNLTGTMRVCSAASELLFASRGCVVNIASMLSYFGSGFCPAYSASKGGVVQLTKSLAIAWPPRGLPANAIAPG